MTDDDVKMVPTAVEPLAMTVVGGTGTGDGSLPGKTLIETPGNAPNIVVQVITPLTAIVVRFANAYLTTLVGLVAAGMTSNIIPYTDFLNLVGTCATLSVAGAALGVLKDLVTIFGRLEGKYPLATGSV